MCYLEKLSPELKYEFIKLLFSLKHLVFIVYLIK